MSMTTHRHLIDINTDWALIADQVFQHEALADGLDGRPVQVGNLLDHLACLTVFIRRLIADRHEFAQLALAAGASLADVQLAMSTDANTASPELHAAALTVPSPRQNMPECVDCSHAFDPDTSPDLDRCWMCVEHHAEEAGR